jgi:PAS domain S-box-containing protein
LLKPFADSADALTGDAVLPVLRMKVLLADHEPMWHEFVAARLQSRGLQPISVVNGERVWSILRERDAPRLVILDRQLPELNGLEICRRLRVRDDPFYTYVLLLLPNSYCVEELVALEAGADDCLSEPFNEDEFFARLAIARRVLDIDRRLSEISTRWRTLLDNLPFGVASVDEKGTIKRMNKTFARQMGFTDLRDLLGQPLCWVLRKKTDACGLLEEIRWSEPFNNVEVQCRGNGGKPHLVRLCGRPLPHNDEAVYEIIVQDLSDGVLD